MSETGECAFSCQSKITPYQKQYDTTHSTTNDGGGGAAAPGCSTLVLPHLHCKPPLIFRNRVRISNSITNRCLSSDRQIKKKDSRLVTTPALISISNVVEPSKHKDKYPYPKRKKSEVEADKAASCAYLKQLLPLAWSHNPLTTLKLICELRDKSYEEAFLTAAYWLHHNHPNTLLCNVDSLVNSFGSIYELSQVLYHVLKGKDGKIRAGKKKSRDNNADEMYQSAIDYKLLHNKVTNVFVECLKSDLEDLKRQKSEPSHVVKSCNTKDPETDHAIRDILLLESIARRVYPRESYPEYQGVEEADYMNRVVDRLKKEVLVPLDKYPFGSRTITSYRQRTFDVEKYLEGVKAGKPKIVADALLPHEIISYVNHWEFGEVAELQWKAMVEDVKMQGEKGNKILNNCLAMCNERGWSDWMPDQNKEISMGFALLVSELNHEPWRGKVIGCFDGPRKSTNELQFIQGEDIRYKCDFMKSMERKPFTEFEVVLDLLLKVAVNENLKPEQMIKKVLVFAQEYDNEPFTNSCWEFKYKAIQRKYKEKGYGDVVPHIVYWTLSKHNRKKPVMPRTLPGVMILTGFSNDLVKLFLDNGGEVEPELVMELAISDKRYQSLSVVD